MNIRATFSGQLAERAGGPERVLDLPDGATVRAAIQHLADHYGDAFAPLVAGDEDADIRRSLLAAVNGRQVRDLDTESLQDGDELMLLMPMSGG